MSTFLSNISARKIRHLRDVKIPLSNDKRTHLIITGKNGSGKTSLLLEMNQFLTSLTSKGLEHIKAHQTHHETTKKQLESANVPNRAQLEKNLGAFRSEVAT